MTGRRCFRRNEQGKILIQFLAGNRNDPVTFEDFFPGGFARHALKAILIQQQTGLRLGNQRFHQFFLIFDRRCGPASVKRDRPAEGLVAGIKDQFPVPDLGPDLRGNIIQIFPVQTGLSHDFGRIAQHDAADNSGQDQVDRNGKPPFPFCP